MITKLSHNNSPLDQIRRAGHIKVIGSTAQLSRKDQITLKHILADKCDYIENDVFKQRAAEKKILNDAPDVARPDTSWYHPVMENITEPRKVKLSANNATLTAAQEQILFTQFNYCRFRVAKIRKKIGDKPVRADHARQILHWYYRADNLRTQIAQTNLALVLAMAKRTRMNEIDFADLVSEGNMALLRAVDKFDVTRGFKFSTYGCRAILKAFSRLGVKQSRYRQLFPTDFDPKLEKSDFLETKRGEHEDDCVDELRTIIGRNRADLTDVEQSVIEHRFALKRFREELEDHGTKPMTLEQVGQVIGLTKERVRQIQNKALKKIRATLEEQYLS